MKTVGSVCSGIEACSVAWSEIGFDVQWLSEIAQFPCQLLEIKYPKIPNLLDMTEVPTKIGKGVIFSSDIICGGTPCQAFSLAGIKQGLNDDRGNLTLKFIDIVNANDQVRLSQSQDRTTVFWENVEGVLKDKTNAFGCFVSALAGLSKAITMDRWPESGVIHGKTRNVAWRVLDAKFFGLAQQRRRLYLVATDTKYFPETVLFERGTKKTVEGVAGPLQFIKDGQKIEVFREYTDCLYAAYGTKWNGNAAAYNGSLFVCQNGKLRRLTPKECERLMGFPDDYTALPKARNTNRYQAVGNSWAVPVVRWIGERLKNLREGEPFFNSMEELLFFNEGKECRYCFVFSKKLLADDINTSVEPLNRKIGSMLSVIDTNPDPKLYISPVGCKGILRRSEERETKINPRLKEILENISSQMSDHEIEKRSRIQKRGLFSQMKEKERLCKQLTLL